MYSSREKECKGRGVREGKGSRLEGKEGGKANEVEKG